MPTCGNIARGGGGALLDESSSSTTVVEEQRVGREIMAAALSDALMGTQFTVDPRPRQGAKPRVLVTWASEPCPQNSIGQDFLTDKVLGVQFCSQNTIDHDFLTDRVWGVQSCPHNSIGQDSLIDRVLGGSVDALQTLCECSVEPPPSPEPPYLACVALWISKCIYIYRCIIDD